MDREDFDIIEELLSEDDEKCFSCQNRSTARCLKVIIILLKEKLSLEKKHLPSIDKKLKKIIKLLETKVEQEDTIIEQLDTKIEQQETIIEQLETKIELETPQPVIDCQCTVIGFGSGPIPPNRAQLIIEVCPDCTIQDSSFDYNVFNPANQSVRQIISVSFNQVICNLNDNGDGTVLITGTSLVRVGVGGPFRTFPFTLQLNVNNFTVSSFTINAGPVNDTVIIDTGVIEVEEC